MYVYVTAALFMLYVAAVDTGIIILYPAQHAHNNRRRETIGVIIQYDIICSGMIGFIKFTIALYSTLFCKVVFAQYQYARRPVSSLV